VGVSAPEDQLWDSPVDSGKASIRDEGVRIA